jgi:hypothetical protein
MKANRGGLGPWEKFHVYTTKDRLGGMAPGEDFIALKSAHFHKFVVNDGGDWVNCNRGSPGPWEKWGGWTQLAPWSIDRIQFDLAAG